MKTVRIGVLALVLVSLLSACAQTRLKNEGNRLLEQGRYELALARFNEALARKPEDEEARMGQSIAQRELDIWLNEVRVQADEEDRRGHAGKALLLYAKLAQLDNDRNALARYKRLHSDLRRANQVNLKLRYPSQFGDGLGANIDGIALRGNLAGLRGKTSEITFEMSQIQIHREVTEVEEVSEYISGYETVENPDYREILVYIEDHYEDIEHHLVDIDRFKVDELDLLRDLDAAERDLEVAKLRLDAVSEGDPEYVRLSQRYRNAKSKVNHVNNDITRVRTKITRSNKSIRNLREENNRLRIDLQSTDPTVQQEVYSDYRYIRYLHKQIASADLIVTENGQVRQQYIEAIDEDDSNEAHSLIDLSRKSAQLKPRSSMESEVYHRAITEAEIILRNIVIEHKQSLLSRANRATNQDTRIDLWVEHGLAGEIGMDASLASRIRNQMEVEFGVAAEFDIVQLINLYE